MEYLEIWKGHHITSSEPVNVEALIRKPDACPLEDIPSSDGKYWEVPRRIWELVTRIRNSTNIYEKRAEPPDMGDMQLDAFLPAYLAKVARDDQQQPSVLPCKVPKQPFRRDGREYVPRLPKSRGTLEECWTLD